MIEVSASFLIVSVLEKIFRQELESLEVYKKKCIRSAYEEGQEFIPNVPWQCKQDDFAAAIRKILIERKGIFRSPCCKMRLPGVYYSTVIAALHKIPAFGRTGRGV